jgi:hypothetical protein
MPLARRGRRRPPFKSTRWHQRTTEHLSLFLSPPVRSTLTAWMKIYGETNNLPGLATGPIEVRFRRLREQAETDLFLIWTTPDRWSAGDALSMRIPSMGIDMDCRFQDGRLCIDKMRPVGEDDRDPRRSNQTVGIELKPTRVDLPLPDDPASDDGEHLERAFERIVGRRWTGFVAPLREALEAEAKDDLERAHRLMTPYEVASPRIGGHSESDPYRLSGIDASACAAFDDGEWLDLMDSRGRVISSARLVRGDPAEGTMDVDVRGADPPTNGSVRPRPQTQIFGQKRAILEELDNPTGSLQHAVRLVASPSTIPPLSKQRPERLVNKLIGRNRSQMRAVSLALGMQEGHALMVQGPPGTGKSTTLAEIIGQLVLRDPTVSLLVCSHSNHGVDNLLLKTLPYLDEVPNLAIARVGLFDRVHPEARKHFVPPGEDLGEFNVVFTTVDALALQTEAGARMYDFAVLDEANRATILDSLIPLVRGHRFILVGDHLQLQPVLSEAEEQLRLEPAQHRSSAVGKSLFTWLRERRFPEAAAVFLEEQNRMHPTIAGLISEAFYEGKLRSGPRAPRRLADIPVFPTPVAWVDTHGLHGLREARGRGASLMNVPEARLVATLARHVLATAPSNLNIGVIAAYAEQTALLRRLLRGFEDRNRGWDAERQAQRGQRTMEIDTVDAFEGREKDIVIVSLVRSNRRRDIGFLRLMQRINVALSRSRRLLIIVGDASTLRGSYFDRIIRYVRAHGMFVAGPRIIGRLLNTRREGGRPGRRRPPVPRAETPAAAIDGAADGSEAPESADGGSLVISATPSRGSRRRRRRQRRRWDPTPERAGQTAESSEEAATAEPNDPEAPRPSRRPRRVTREQPELPAAAELASDARAEQPSIVRRRPRRVTRDQSDAPAQAPLAEAPSAAQPVDEQPAVRRRPRRVAAVEATVVETPVVETPVADQPVDPAPKKRRTTRAKPVEVVAEEPPPTKPRATRRKADATPPADTPAVSTNGVGDVEKPAPRRRTSTRVAAVAGSVPPVEEPKPRRARTRKTADAEPAAAG